MWHPCVPVFSLEEKVCSSEGKRQGCGECETEVCSLYSQTTTFFKENHRKLTAIWGKDIL